MTDRGVIADLAEAPAEQGVASRIVTIVAASDNERADNVLVERRSERGDRSPNLAASVKVTVSSRNP